MKALTFGSATIDTIAIIASDRIERMAMLNADRAFLLMEEGKKTEAEEISMHLGGGGVNTAVSLARLGFETAALIKLGDDLRADRIFKGLEREGVSTGWARRDAKLATGSSVMIASHERNAGIFTYRGANTCLSAHDIADAPFAVDLVHIAPLSHPSAALAPEIVKRACKAGAQISANPGMRQLSARAGELLSVFDKIDILMINKIEAEAFVPALAPQFGEGPRPGAKGRAKPPGDAPALYARGLSGGGFDMALPHFLAALLKTGLGAAVVTDGARGAYAAADGEMLFCPPVELQAAGAAGAGDAFASTFAAWRARREGVEKALAAASLNAASVISAVDTQSGLLTRATLEQRLNSAKLIERIQRWPISI